MFKVDESGKGFPRIVIGRHRYRKDTALTNGDIRWRCLGKTCRASARTDAEMTALLSQRGDHTGDHPVPVLSQMAKSPSLSPRLTGVNPNNRLSADNDNFLSLPSSPLVSQSILKRTVYDIACQTDQLCLKKTDELLTRIEELTSRQSCLIERIQQLQQELDEEKEKNNDLNQTVLQLSRTSVASASTNTEEINYSTVSVQTDELTVLDTSCTTCAILKEESRHMIDTIRIMEEELKHTDRLDKREHKATEEIHTTYNVQTRNRFLPLEDLCTENKAKHTSHRPIKHKKTKQAHPVQNVGNLLTEPCKPSSDKTTSSKQLLIFSDSHGRSLSGILSTRVPASVSALVSVHPGAPARCVVRSAIESVDKLTASDHLVVLAGTNDVNIGSLNNWQESIISQYRRLARTTEHTNLLLCSVPMRYDLSSRAVAQTVGMINAQILDLSRQFNHVRYLNLEDSPRYWYTKHGLHFNKFGKKRLAESILSNVLCRDISGVVELSARVADQDRDVGAGCPSDHQKRQQLSAKENRYIQSFQWTLDNKPLSLVGNTRMQLINNGSLYFKKFQARSSLVETASAAAPAQPWGTIQQDSYADVVQQGSISRGLSGQDDTHGFLGERPLI